MVRDKSIQKIHNGWDNLGGTRKRSPNKTINDFFLYSNDEKIKIIELGLSLYKNGMETMKYLDCFLLDCFLLDCYIFHTYIYMKNIKDKKSVSKIHKDRDNLGGTRKRSSNKRKSVKYQLTKPILLSKKINDNEYHVTIQGNYRCTAKLNIGKITTIRDLPIVNDLDLIMIDIPNITNRASLVPLFVDDEKKLKNIQRKHLYYYHATFISFDYESGTSLCLSVNENPKEKGYRVADFPSSVSNALLGLLIGGH